MHGKHTTWLERTGWLLVGLLVGTGATVAADETRSLDTIYQKLEVFAEVLGHIENHYVDQMSPTALAYGAARGLTSALDAHSTFFSPEEYRTLVDATEGEYAGIGIELDMREGLPEIIAVFEGSPAHKAGIGPGDRIIAIDGQVTEGLDFDTVQRRLRGPVGTKLLLVVMRRDQEEPWTFTLVRGWIRVAPLEHRTFTGGVSYVWLKSFSRRVAKDLEGLLQREPPEAGLVLDLRGNPGGLFDEAVAVCDLFLTDGPIVAAIGRGGTILEQEVAHPQGTLPSYKVAVLIDQSSASAAEIVAGALRDRGRARLFGSRSYGKGSVQSILDLSDGSGLKLTVARYLTPSGKQIEGKGIEPDELIDDDEDGDATIKAAVAWVRKR